MTEKGCSMDLFIEGSILRVEERQKNLSRDRKKTNPGHRVTGIYQRIAFCGRRNR